MDKLVEFHLATLSLGIEPSLELIEIVDITDRFRSATTKACLSVLDTIRKNRGILPANSR